MKAFTSVKTPDQSATWWLRESGFSFNHATKEYWKEGVVQYGLAGRYQVIVLGASPEELLALCLLHELKEVRRFTFDNDAWKSTKVAHLMGTPGVILVRDRDFDESKL